MEKPKSNLGQQLGGIIGAGATIASSLGIGAAGADRRQRRQQEALNQINAKTAKEMADYEQQLKMKMWQDTNYGAILNEAEKAGVSKTAAIGGGVSGTQGASVASVGGGQAASGVEGQRVQNEQLMMMAQLANINADTKLKTASAEKTSGADTRAVEQTTAMSEFELELQKTLKDHNITKRIAETDLESIKRDRENADWETYKAVGYKGGDFKDENSEIAKAMKAGFEREVTELEKAKTENDIKKAELVIGRFEAALADQGIHPKSPWGVKLVIDLLDKAGLGDIFGTAVKATKNAITN